MAASTQIKHQVKKFNYLFIFIHVSKKQTKITYRIETVVENTEIRLSCILLNVLFSITSILFGQFEATLGRPFLENFA